MAGILHSYPRATQAARQRRRWIRGGAPGRRDLSLGPFRRVDREAGVMKAMLLAAGRTLIGCRMGTDESHYWIDTPDDFAGTDRVLAGIKRSSPGRRCGC